MKVGVTSTKHIASMALRFDPSLHLSEGLKVRDDLTKSPYGLITINDVSDNVFYGNIFSRVFVKDKKHGKTYLAASDTVLANIETGRYLSNKQSIQLKHLWLKKDWILVTCSGTLGNVTYTNRTFEDKIATHDLIRIVPNDKLILKGVVYAFLAGKYGYYQITQSQFGGVVKHINDKEVGRIIIPHFPESFQQEVDDLIQESARLREEAAEAFEKAKAILTTFIGDDFNKVDKKYVGKVSINSIRKTLNIRFDPPVYINKGVSTVQNLSCKTIPLGECNARFWYPGIFKRAYVKEGLPYIKGSSLFEVNPFKRCDYLSRSRTPGLEDLWLKEGQILMSCAGICGQVKLITKEFEDKKAIGSPDIIRIQPMDALYTKEYLFAYLQLPFVYDYMQSLKYGSVIERFDIDTIKTIPVVTPTKELSEEITVIIKRYMDCTYRAFNAEEKAIRMVEEEIEKWNT